MRGNLIGLMHLFRISWHLGRKFLLLAPAFLSAHQDLRFQKTSLAGKDQGKYGIQHLSFFHTLCNQIPKLVEQWAHIIPSLPFVASVFTKLLSLTSLARCNSIWSIAFPASPLDAHMVSLHSSLFLHRDLLAFLSNFLLIEMDLSWASWRRSLNITQLFWPPLPCRATHTFPSPAGLRRKPVGSPCPWLLASRSLYTLLVLSVFPLQLGNEGGKQEVESHFRFHHSSREKLASSLSYSC